MDKKIFNPKAWIPADSKPAPQPQSHQNQPQTATPASGNELATDIETITQRIEASCTDIAPTYAQWRDLDFALSDALGENGRSYFHRLSTFYPGYDAANADDQYTKCLRAHGTDVTAKTFFQLAKDAGIPVGTRPDIIKLSKSSKLSADKIDNTDNLIISAPEEELPTFSDKVRTQLPLLLRRIIEVADNERDADILLLGALTAFSACLTKVCGIYDKRIVYPNLFTFITARASAGKGRLTLCKNLIDPIHNELRDLNEAERLEYKNRLNEYNCSKNKKSMEKPEEPPLRLLLIPANSSATAVYQTLNENDGKGLMFETEGDTLANTFDSDYGNYSDGFRKAFHHEAISYIRRKDKEYVSIKSPCLSTLLTGTPAQVRSLTKDAENGLFSRFMFYYLNAKSEWHDVFDAGGGMALDEYFRQIGEEFYSLYKLLQPLQSVRVEMTADQRTRFNAYFADIQTRQMDSYGEYIVASVRRMSLSTFRIILILTALRIPETGELSPTLYCTNEDFRTALKICDCIIVHIDKVFSQLPTVEENSGAAPVSESTRQLQFSDTLPESFDRKEYLRLAQILGIPTPSADRYVKKWLEDGKLEKVEHGKYRKRSE